MKKAYTALVGVIIIGIIGFIFYELNAPFTLNEVVISDGVDGYSKHNS